MKTLLCAIATLFALGCSAAASGPPDPTSREVLQKAPEFKWGTTCTRVESSSYGTASDRTETPRCFDKLDCNDFESEEAIGYGGGATYNSYSYWKDVKYFTGTCADPTPVTCDERPVAEGDACARCQYDHCCGQVAVCEDDPNCVAVNDCLVGCKTDEKCAQGCLSNGEYSAVKRLKSAYRCMSGSCTTECGFKK
jgi:hypothetical protein